MPAIDLRLTKPVTMMVTIKTIMVNTKENHGYPNCLTKNHKLNKITLELQAPYPQFPEIFSYLGGRP